jgi:hypothetical protein
MEYRRVTIRYDIADSLPLLQSGSPLTLQPRVPQSLHPGLSSFTPSAFRTLLHSCPLQLAPLFALLITNHFSRCNFGCGYAALWSSVQTLPLPNPRSRGTFQNLCNRRNVRITFLGFVWCLTEDSTLCGGKPGNWTPLLKT